MAAARKALDYVRDEPREQHRRWHLWCFIDCHKMLGEQLAMLPEGDYATSFATAVGRLEGLMEEAGWQDEPKLRFQLALMYGSWSYADAKRGDIPAVRIHLDTALAILDPLTKDFPDRVPYQDAWMRGRERLVYLNESLGNRDAALDLLKESVARGDAWLQNAPDHEKLAWRVQQAKDMLAKRR